MESEQGTCAWKNEKEVDRKTEVQLDRSGEREREGREGSWEGGMETHWEGIDSIRKCMRGQRC